MEKAVSMSGCFRERTGFTLLEVMISAALVAVAVVGLVRTLDQGLSQTEIRRWHASLAGQLDVWTHTRLNTEFYGSELAAGPHTTTVALGGEPATLRWIVIQSAPGLKRLDFRLEPVKPAHPVITWQAARSY